MARQLTNDEMQRLALLGARSRLEALQAETRRIIADFPQLRRESRRQPAAAAAAPATATAGRPRRRRKKPAWSDEARRAVSERMKKYWASRRKTGAKR